MFHYLSTMDKKILTLQEVAYYLGFSRATMYNMIKDGRFPVQPIRGVEPPKWNIEDVDAWRFGR